MKYFLILLSVVLLSACGKATIDASSQDALQQSVEKIAEDMDQQEKAEFQQAVITIAMHHSSAALQQAMSGNNIDAADVERQMLDALHGKSADEVISYAKGLK